MEDSNAIEEELKEALQKEKKNVEDRYSQILSNLENEREKIQAEIRREFRTARRYVRANPEIGLGAAFTGGILAGMLIATMFNK